MKTCSSQKCSGNSFNFPERSLGNASRSIMAVLVVFAISIQLGWAGSATWSSSAGSNDWNTASNWIPLTVPNGPSDVASFLSSSQKNISLSIGVEVSAIVFNPGANAFTITHASEDTLFIVGGPGVTNNSSEAQNFFIGAPDHFNVMQFMGTASAGVSTIYTTNPGGTGGGSSGGNVWFSDNSSAGQATFINRAATVPGSNPGSVTFFDGTSAADGIFVNEGATVNAPAGAMGFNGASAGNGVFTNNGGSADGAGGGSVQFAASGGSAENGTFINNGGIITGAGGGSTTLFENTKAENGIFVANGGVNGGDGGSIVFRDSATGDNAQFKIFGNGNLDVSVVSGVSVGSLEGDGLVKLSSGRLSVGTNDQNTTFAGSIAGGDGTFEKIGSGSLNLSGIEASFTGTAKVTAGVLEVTHDNALGAGDVEVSAGSTLRLQDGSTNDYIPNTSTLTLVDGSIVNLNFTGPPDKVLGLTIDGVAQDPGVYGSAASGAAHPLPQFTGTGKLLVGPSTKSRLLNISTRLQVQAGDNVLIGGFIITGFGPKNVIVRGIGPSLENSGVAGVLANPTLQLVDAFGQVLATNDDWRDSQEAEIDATGLAPSDDREAAIIWKLQPNAYTAILQGEGDSTGIGLVEVYDLDDATTNAAIANISTRGFVQTGDNVMIGGVILGPEDGGSAGIVVRAVGPSLADSGISNPLQDPVLSAYDSNGTLIAENDDWKDAQENLLATSGLAPNDDRESALLLFLSPGNYTAVITGKDGGTGVALAEFYNLE